MQQVEKLRVLSDADVREAATRFGTPVYVYDEATLRSAAQALLAVPAPYGLTARYAIKANPNNAILRLFDAEGLHFDASSTHEVWRANIAGIQAHKILLTSQQVPSEDDVRKLVQSGVHYAAASLRQLDVFGRANPRGTVSVRINPGAGVGAAKRTQTGGPQSSFGIWHEYIGEVHAIAAKHGLTIERVHTHVGTGGDPDAWAAMAAETIALLKRFPTAHIVNLGGGFSVARMAEEEARAANVTAIGARIARELERFHAETGRALRLELEPGTFLTANAGALIARVEDIVDTGRDGYAFIKLDTGLNDILRPGMYGAQHAIVVVDGEDGEGDFVFVGHTCEPGDILTPARGNPEAVEPRRVRRPRVGSLVVIEGAGAYCAAFSAAGYNSFPSAAEIIRETDGSLDLISRRGEQNALVVRENYLR
jgi:diaminopimelate decarboxylase